MRGVFLTLSAAIALAGCDSSGTSVGTEASASNAASTEQSVTKSQQLAEKKSVVQTEKYAVQSVMLEALPKTMAMVVVSELVKAPIDSDELLLNQYKDLTEIVKERGDNHELKAQIDVLLQGAKSAEEYAFISRARLKAAYPAICFNPSAGWPYSFLSERTKAARYAQIIIASCDYSNWLFEKIGQDLSDEVFVKPKNGATYAAFKDEFTKKIQQKLAEISDQESYGAWEIAVQKAMHAHITFDGSGFQGQRFTTQYGAYENAGAGFVVKVNSMPYIGAGYVSGRVWEVNVADASETASSVTKANSSNISSTTGVQTSANSNVK